MWGRRQIRFPIAVLCVCGALWWAGAGWDHARGNREIDFYAQVVDLEGRPVPRAKVVFRVLGRNRLFIPFPWSSSDVFAKPGECLADEDGRVAITGYRGTSLVLERIESPGLTDLLWSKTPEQRVYTYHSVSATPGEPVHVADPDHPVLLHMQSP
jgi:hypothetical protein